MKQNKFRINSSVLTTLIIVVAVMIMFFAILNSFSNSNTINVQGQSTIQAVPDLISVYFNIETNAETSKQAKDENAKIINNLTTKILKLGFEKKDLQTQNFNIYQDYKWINRQQIPNGYKAIHSLKIELSTEQFDKVGEVIDAGVDSGAGINYVNFELSQEKQNQYKAQAMKLAAQDARIKAESVAQGFDKKLGKLVSTSVNDFGYSPWRIYDFAGMKAEEIAEQPITNIEPSEKEISAQVTAVFKLK